MATSEHELHVRFLKGADQWVGECTCGRFEIDVPGPKRGDKPPAVIAANYELHAQRH